MYKLRGYQQEAVDNAIDFFSQLGDVRDPVELSSKKKKIATYVRSCVLKLATGAGKSLIVAELARHYWDTTGKRVLCIQPSKELTEQNHEKFEDMVGEASIFSGSIRKEVNHQVIFGTPQSVINEIEAGSSSFDGERFALLVVDECHRNTEATRKLYDAMRKTNPDLLLLGLSATPFRLGEGFLYELDMTGQKLDERQARKPMFKKLVAEVDAPFLIHEGYLTKPVWGQDDIAYDTSTLVIDKGQFTPESVQATFEGKKDKTQAIVDDIILMSEYRKGVMIFGSTVKHCEEILRLLPAGEAAMVSAKTRKATREKIIAKFKARKLKYLVNVSTLTTGFDAPHVDVVAILRGTESAALYLQIVGRGMRLDEGKDDCLMLDYAGNFERLGLPEDDLEMFDIKFEVPESKEGQEHVAHCPSCQTANDVIIPFKFACDMMENGWQMDGNGFLFDLMGNPMKAPESDVARWHNDQLPAHAGRRCKGEHFNPRTNSFERCGFFWIWRDCPECGVKNDIAATTCRGCSAELISPNEKLSITPQGDVVRSLTQKGKEAKARFEKLKRDPNTPTADKFLSLHIHGERIIKNGDNYPRLSLMINNGKKVILNFNPKWGSHYDRAEKVFTDLCVAAFGRAWCRKNLNGEDDMGMIAIVSQEWYVRGLEATSPNHPIKTISTKQVKDFWQIRAFNEPEFIFNPDEDYL